MKLTPATTEKLNREELDTALDVLSFKTAARAERWRSLGTLAVLLSMSLHAVLLIALLPEQPTPVPTSFAPTAAAPSATIEYVDTSTRWRSTPSDSPEAAVYLPDRDEDAIATEAEGPLGGENSPRGPFVELEESPRVNDHDHPIQSADSLENSPSPTLIDHLEPARFRRPQLSDATHDGPPTGVEPVVAALDAEVGSRLGDDGSDATTGNSLSLAPPRVTSVTVEVHASSSLRHRERSALGPFSLPNSGSGVTLVTAALNPRSATECVAYHERRITSMRRSCETDSAVHRVSARPWSMNCATLAVSGPVAIECAPLTCDFAPLHEAVSTGVELDWCNHV